MERYVTDTHILLWFFSRDRRLPRSARLILQAAREERMQVLVPSIVLIEMQLLAQRHRVSDSSMKEIMTIPDDPNKSIYVYPLDILVVRAFSEFGPSVVPELPDRVIAATARALNLPLMTVDPEIIQSGLVKVVQ